MQVIYGSGNSFYLLSKAMWLIPWKEKPFKELIQNLLHYKFLLGKWTAPFEFLNSQDSAVGKIQGYSDQNEAKHIIPD